MIPLKVFDASHLTYRMYHAAKRTDPDNVLDTAIYFFFNSIFSVSRTDSNTPMVFLYDAKNSTKHRKNIDENYKSNRVANPDVIELKRRLVNYLNSLGLVNIEIEGLEADDIAYYMSRNLDNPITFISDDKDWISYVVDNKSLVRPIAKESVTFNQLLVKYSPIIDGIIKGSDLESYLSHHKLSIQELVHKLVIDRKAILGDGSDNIKGFKGIGPKTASKLVVKLNRIESITEFNPKTSAEKLFIKGYDRFLDNRLVLGYSHIDELDIKPTFQNSSINQVDYKESLLKLSDDIRSSRLESRVDSLVKILESNNVDINYLWR